MQANNTRGFVPEPDGRGTIGILWSCLATLIVCFWSSLHADFDGSDSHLDLIPRMMAAVTYPDFLVANSVREYLQARSDVKRINGLPQVVQNQATWSIMHAFYVNLGAFILEDRKSVTMVQLIGLIQLGYISPKPPPLEEVKARSKRSRFAKFLGLMQITWFALQVLARAIQHTPISLLELNTASYAVLTMTAYIFAWYKPVNVLIPTVNSLLPTCEFTIEQVRTYLNQFKSDTQKREPPNNPALNEDNDHPTSEPKTEPNDTPTQNDLRNDEVVDAAKLGTFTTEPVAIRDLESQQTPSMGGLIPLPTVPQDNLNPGSAITTDDALEVGARLKNYLAGNQRHERFTNACVFPLASLVFSALHCLAWNFYFPSTTERWLWRVVSVVAGVVALLHAPLGYFDSELDDVVIAPVMTVGILVKLTLLLETFVALRRMPAGVYDTVHWANFFPHI